MSEDDQTMEIGVGVSLAVKMDDHVVVVRISAEDRPGTFRVQRGPTSWDAYQSEAVETRPPDGLDAEEWSPLGKTGLEVKVNQWPPQGPVRIGVRRATAP